MLTPSQVTKTSGGATPAAEMLPVAAASAVLRPSNEEALMPPVAAALAVPHTGNEEALMPPVAAASAVLRPSKNRRIPHEELLLPSSVPEAACSTERFNFKAWWEATVVAQSNESTTACQSALPFGLGNVRRQFTGLSDISFEREGGGRRSSCRVCSLPIPAGGIRFSWWWHISRPHAYVHYACLGRVPMTEDERAADLRQITAPAGPLADALLDALDTYAHLDV